MFVLCVEMAKSANTNTNTVPKLYRSVIDDVVSDVRDIFLDDGVDEQVLMELKTLWENKLMQSRAVDGCHSEEQQLLLQVQQQQHHHHQQQQQAQPQQTVPQQTVPQQAETQQVLIPAAEQATAPQVIVPDSKLIQQMNATAATLAPPAGVTPVQQILTNSGQLLPVVRAAQGAQYIFQPQQTAVLQQPVIPQMQPGAGQTPVIQQVLAPLPGGISPQTRVIIQPQQVLFTGNKTQVIPTTVAAPTPAQAEIPTAGQQQPSLLNTTLHWCCKLMEQGDTSSEEHEAEEDYDDHEKEEKEKDGAEDGQVEEEPLNSEDGLSDEEEQELFDTENVVECQYEKTHRSKNKWKFHLKDGIMRAGEMAQRLRAPTALLKVVSSNPSNHMMAHNHP